MGLRCFVRTPKKDQKERRFYEEEKNVNEDISGHLPLKIDVIIPLSCVMI